MNCCMLSSCVVDPTLDVASDDRSNPLSGTSSSATTSYEDADEPRLSRDWSFAEGLDDDIGGDDERLLPLWLPEQQLAGTNWHDVRSPSPAFPSDEVDRLSRDLWTISSSWLLVDDDEDTYGGRTVTTTAKERSVWGTWYSHATSTSTDDDCPVSRCSSRDSPSRDSSSVDDCPPTSTVKLAGSTSDYSPSSRSNVGDQGPPVHVWKRRRRRRRRRRRWSRQSGVSLTSTTRRLNSDGSADHGAHILRSLLLHSSQDYGYRCPQQASATFGRRFGLRAVAPAGTTDDVAAAAAQQLRRTASSPMIVRRLSAAAGNETDVAARRRSCLADHCYFNWRQTSRLVGIGRCQDTQQAAWSAPVSQHYQH